MPKTKSQNHKALNFKPLYGNVLIKQDDAETETPEGIILPTASQEAPKTGTVIAIGQGQVRKDNGELIPLTVKPNDRVLFQNYAGATVNINEQNMLIMTEHEILGIMS